MKGIFVNENGGVPYAAAIVIGIKPIETRGKNMLSACVGEKVAIIRTRRNKAATVVGYAKIDKATFESASWLDAHRNQTLIPTGSAYDATTRGKWCYHLSAPETCMPYQLPLSAIRHGRSWCEF